MKLDLAVGQIWEVEAECGVLAPEARLVWKFEIVGKVIRKRKNCWIAIKKRPEIPGQLDVAVFDDRGKVMKSEADMSDMEWFLVERVKKGMGRGK